MSSTEGSLLLFLERRPAAWTWIGLVVLLGVGCSDGGGGGAPPPPTAAVTGQVLGGGPVEGAKVAFVEAFSASARNSVQPLEDIAATAPIQATTDRDGRFSVGVPAGRYFIYVIPGIGDGTHLPGGNLSRSSFELGAGTTTVVNVTLSEQPSDAATYVGSSKCLECHPAKATAKQTLHFLGFRKLTAAGSVTSSLQDLSKFPDSNRGLTYFPDGNPSDNTGSGSDGYGYRLVTTSGYSVLLGVDGTGYFQALEGPGGLVSEKLYIVFTYGGEGRYKQRYITRLDKSGNYTSDPTAGSYQVLPGQYSETQGDPGRGNEVTVPEWVTYNPQNWGPPAANGGPAGTVPTTVQSFDNQCAGCHFTGMSLTRNGDGLFQAHAVSDPGGPIDFDGDGKTEEMNIGCERCHGPGSEHVAQGGGAIVDPEYLPAGRAAMVCGQCHNRGTGNGTIDGEGKGGYPSQNGAGGAMEFVTAGIAPADFFGTPDGTGILPSFGTTGGFYNPFNFATSTASSWLDRSGGYGSDFDHAKQHRPQYVDHTRALHFQNPYEVLACWDCHDAHSRERTAQTSSPADNNALCLGCHAGFGDFGAVSADMVDTIAGGGAQDPAISQALQKHVTDRTFDLVGVAMNLGVTVYSTPGTDGGFGRCITCHMAKTAKTASWITDAQGYVIEGDIHAHTFDVISPDVSKRMAEAGADPVPNSCVPCHRGPVLGAWPDYRYKKQ